MNYWVCTAGRYRSASILERVYAAFVNYNQFDAMTNMPDEIIIVRMVTTLDLEFEIAYITMMKGMRLRIARHPCVISIHNRGLL